MTTHYLKFADQNAAIAAMDGIDDIDADIVGVITRIDADGTTTALDGWHVNVSAVPPALAQYEVFPTTLFRVFAGAEPVTPDINEVRAAKWADIKAERDRRKFGGVHVAGQWIHSDVFSRTQWMAMVIMGAALPAVSWATLDGALVTTTQALAAAVFQAVALLDATTFAVAKQHKAAMEAAADPAAYDFSAGWPATYGE